MDAELIGELRSPRLAVIAYCGAFLVSAALWAAIGFAGAGAIRMASASDAPVVVASSK